MSARAKGPHVIGEWISARARLNPRRVAIEFFDRPITYQELDEGSTQLARALLVRGLCRGDRVATLSENRPEHVELFFACAKAGLILAPLNSQLTSSELAAQLRDFSPALVIASQVHRGRFEAACAVVEGLGAPLRLEHLLEDLDGERADSELPTVCDDDGLLLIATSGTTGAAKGAVLTHANCFWTNLSLDLSAPITSDDVVLQVLPQCHVGGWNVQSLLAWWKGATVILEPRFDPPRALELIARRRVTTMMGVPTTYLVLAQLPDFGSVDLTSLRSVISGGAAMPLTLLRQWHERGVGVIQGYGLTEASPNVFCLAFEDAFTHAGSVGKPYAYVDVALHDDATNTFVEGVGSGEIYLRGPNVFKGYWNNPEATANTLVDGWLRTGDIAERDEAGYYRISGRSKEMYISGGENVYPAEVEEIIVAHRDVVEAAVVAVEHPRWGETGVAFIVARSDVDLDVDALLHYCRERLAPFKVPSAIRVVEELPRSHVGKLDRARLRTLAALGTNEGDAVRP